jgi:type IV secretory pathway ATPase VirB11/archaellum biosynthesis ATPase
LFNLGEVRSVEAKALYEAMRVGALANVVAGTIHGASPMVFLIGSLMI